LVAIDGKANVDANVLEPDREVALWWKPDDAVVIDEAGANPKEGQE
jgi:hypothetical protein